MVADAVIYHPTVSHYLKYVATTVGRDKLLRALQYFSRFYAWYLYRMNYTPSAIAPYEAAKRQFGIVRRVLRLGKFVEHFKAAAQAVDATGLDPVLRYCAIGRQLGYAIYLTLDSILVPDILGIRLNPLSKRIQTEAYRAWMAGLLFNTISGVYTLYHLKQRAVTLTGKNGKTAVEKKELERSTNTTKLQLLSDLCDLTIPASAVGYANLDDGLVGLAGTISSLIGVYSVWMKTA